MGGEEALPSPADLADLRGCCGTGVLKGRLRRSRGREIIRGVVWKCFVEHRSQGGRCAAKQPLKKLDMYITTDR
jgi:hypothetical protein